MRMGKDKNGTRSGFTLTEVLVASAIGIATLGVVLSLFLASQRVLENAMAQIQMSYEMRMLRDKLLFRINEHGGLMSAKHDDFSIQVVSNGWGNAMTYTPFTPGGAAAENSVTILGGELKATEEFGTGWLSGGQIVFGDGAVPFALVGNGVIGIDAVMELRVGGRTYSQKQPIKAQIMSQ